MLRVISPRLGRTVCTVTGGAAFCGASAGERPQPPSASSPTRRAKTARTWYEILGRRLRGVRLKSEGRKPKAERRPKPEIRVGLGPLGSWADMTAVNSGFGLRASFGLRPLAFGLPSATSIGFRLIALIVVSLHAAGAICPWAS